MYYDWYNNSAEPTSPEKSSRLMTALLFLICLAWIMPGLIGHDPWKPDEAYSFGLVHHILKTGDWVVPTLAGEPFMEKPPLYYIVAAGFATLFSPPLQPHDAARLATGFFMGLTLLFVGLAGRELFGRDRGTLSAIALIGCLGILIRGHELITDIALLAGIAMALYGLALSLHRAIPAGLLLGTGVGIAFMSKGLLGPGMIGITAMLLPVVFRTWRTRAYLTTVVVSVVAALPWLIIWPLALYQRSPELFTQWFWVNNFGRFFGFVRLGPSSGHGAYVEIIPWFTWPALPLALWALWVERRTAFQRPEFQLPVTAFVVMLSVLTLASDAREVYALPLLVPIAYLAAAAANTLRRGAANALYWFSILGALFFAAVIWFYWIAANLGVPQDLSAHLHDLQPGYVPRLDPVAFGFGAFYTIGWLLLVIAIRHTRERSIVAWTAGMSLIWGLLMTLFVSWIDAGKSYHSMLESMQAALPAQYNCMASKNLGEPQRALLDYRLNIITRRAETNRSQTCDLMLVQGWSDDQITSPGEEWTQIWEGHRPGDKKERYRLFKRNR
jgi:4-amino-4-deoxy-L-arabinose transferase-like glycosyltransferase